MYWTRRVSRRNAGIAEPMNCSPSPRPMISGHSLRAPTSTPGLVGAHRDERVVAAQLGVGGADRVEQAALREVVGDQVRDHLGVGLGGERRAHVDQPALQRDVVLDDPVDDDVDAVGRVEVRVGVLLGDAPVRRPARVADAGAAAAVGVRDRARCRAVARGAGVDRAAQRAQVADRAHRVDPAAVEHRDPGAVVAAVFELLEPREQQRASLSGSDVADDAAHASRAPESMIRWYSSGGRAAPATRVLQLSGRRTSS